MKVFVATGIYPPESGGPATYTKLLEEYLPKEGVDVEVLPYRTVRMFPKVLRHIFYAFKCIRPILSADIVYAQDAVSVGLPACIVAGILRKPFVVRIPGDYAWEQGRQRFGVSDTIEDFQNKKYSWRVEFFRAIQRYVVRRARCVVVPSNYMQGIVSLWVTDSQKVETIYSSISMPVETLLPKNRPEGFLIVTVGRLVPWKHIDQIILTLKSLPEVSLVVVDDGPLRTELEALVVSENLSERVSFVGRLPREEVMGWVAASDLFVLNSSYEGLSYLLVEAMALGTPVIATNVGGNPELVRDGVDGRLINAGDTEMLVRTIRSLKDNKAECEHYALSAKKRVEESFSIDVAVKKLTTLFMSVCT